MKRAPPSTFLLVLAGLLVPALARAEEPPPTPPTAARAWSVSLGTGAGGFVELVDSYPGGSPAGCDSSSRQGRLQLNARVERELEGGYLVGVAWTYNR
jgi:hypothetical protein